MILLFIITRLALVVIGVFSNGILYPYYSSDSEISDTNKIFLESDLYLNIWHQFDSNRYRIIARDGYDFEKMPPLYGSFPLYPLLIRMVNFVFHNLKLAGIIVSNISFILGLFFLYKLLILDFSERLVRKTIFIIFIFPVSFFFSGILSESTFLLLSVLCLYYARKNNWVISGIFGFFSALTRINGALLILPLGYLYILYMKKHKLEMKTLLKNIGSILLVPLGFCVYYIYLVINTGTLFPLHYAHKFTGKKMSLPFLSLFEGIYQLRDFFHLFFTVFIIIIAFYLLFYRIIPLEYTIYFITGLIFYLSFNNLSGMPRYMVVYFPICLTLSILSKKEYIRNAIIIFFPLLQGFLMVFWSTEFFFVY